MRTTLLLVCAALLSGPSFAHEGPKKKQKPTKAQADLDRARAKLDAAKKQLAKQGRYSCCVKPSCDLCARTTGSCNCARNVAAGKGACGECYAGWKAGRGTMKGVDAKALILLPADHQACAQPATSDVSPELKDAIDALLGAKKTLVAEKRFACCIRGGCGQCAREGDCPCGGDLAAGKGVCGDGLDGWNSGLGIFEGIQPAEVKLAPMESASMDAGMGPGTGESSGLYSSGTSQVPRTAGMNMLDWRVRNWSLMLNGQIFGVYSAQSGPRGRDKIFSANWVMAMASRKAGIGTLSIRAMLSLEPATITSQRYPLLFATGETANGVPIINGQHPHDLFMELAALYQIRLGERTTVTLYGGPRGEPALGPPAYPHRVSASENPVAVISHHLQDSTHISDNVATAGITHRFVTFEVSGFHGREPDEKRWGFDGGAIDSFSTRLTLTPTTRWSGQISIGRINQREATHPLRPTLRTTASAMYVRPLAKGQWATSVIWGRDNDLEYTQLPNLAQFQGFSTGALSTLGLPGRPPFRPQHIVTIPTRIPRQIYNSYLLESTAHLGRNWVWGRIENTDKDSTLLYEEAPFVLLVDERRLARVQAYTAGYERDLPGMPRALQTGVGGQFTIFHAPPVLAPIYGNNLVGVQLFLRLRLGATPNR
ncbi:MAG: hypothetical protein ABI823_08445 [Bryobacteraceae bacterium]